MITKVKTGFRKKIGLPLKVQTPHEDQRTETLS